MIKWQIITIDHKRQSSDRHILAKPPQQCKREIPAPSTPYQHLHKGMLNYSLIIRESPCGRRMTRRPAANWHINNPACLWWRGSRSQCRNLLSASTFCLAASTVCRRIRTRRHTCSAVSWLIGRRHAGLLLLRLLRVAPILMLYISSWCRYVMSSHQLILVCCCKKRESFLLSILSSLEKNIWKSLCTSEGRVNTTQSCRQSVDVKFENFSSIAKVTVWVEMVSGHCLIYDTAIMGSIQGNNVVHSIDFHFIYSQSYFSGAVKY